MNHEPLLRAEGLSRIFHQGRKGRLAAVCDVSLTIAAGETVGILGESGSGKSTLGQMITGLQKTDSGQIWYQGQPLSYPFRGKVRRQLQILFQHPEVSFNPRLTMLTSLREPYRLYHKPFSREILLRDIRSFGLYEEHLDRLPVTLSGGELQRAALARILIAEPRLIVLDEPTSMLDSISQAQMISLLRQVQATQHTAFLFITHDRALCRAFAHRVYTMDEGHISPTDLFCPLGD